MRETAISLACTLIVGVTGREVFSFALATIGGLWVILNQYYRTKRDVKKNHAGSWKRYFKSLKLRKK